MKMPSILVAGFLWCCLLNALPALAKNDDQAVFDSLYNEAFTEMYGNPQRVVHLFNKTYGLKNIDRRKQAEFHLLYAIAERMRGDFDGCIKTLLVAEDLLSGQWNTNLIRARIYDLKSICYCTLSDFNTAIRLNDEATAIFKAENDSTGLAVVYNTRGIIHAFLNEYPQADKFLKHALVINRTRHNLRGVAANLNNLSLYEGDCDEKQAFLDEAIVLNRNLNAVWALAENYNNKGRQYLYAGEYDKALAALKEAYKLALSIEAKGLICDNNEFAALTYYAMGRYKEAYEKQRNLIELTQELQNVNELWALERSVTQQKLYFEQQKARAKQQKYETKLLYSYFLIVGVVAVSAFVIGMFLHQRYRRRKKWQLMKANYQLEQSQHELAKSKVKQQELELKNVQQELDHSRKETTDMAVFMQSRDELLDKIRNLIKDGYKMENADLLVHLKKVNAFIKQYQLRNNVDSSIIQVIDEKNKEFVERLLERHPELTQGERHLAVLLRVNFSTKDVALLTGTTPKTINMNRYRLRKALNLEGNIDLVEYLKSV